MAFVFYFILQTKRLLEYIPDSNFKTLPQKTSPSRSVKHFARNKICLCKRKWKVVLWRNSFDWWKSSLKIQLSKNIRTLKRLAGNLANILGLEKTKEKMSMMIFASRSTSYLLIIITQCCRFWNEVHSEERAGGGRVDGRARD